MGSCEHTFNNWTQKIIAVLYLSEIWVMKDDHQRNPNYISLKEIMQIQIYSMVKCTIITKETYVDRKEIMLLGDLLLIFG